MFLKNSLIVILLLILIPFNTFATESADEDEAGILSPEVAVKHKAEAPLIEELAKQRKEQTEPLNFWGSKLNPGTRRNSPGSKL